jgi:Rps23 Pro-64 3,4-dihydroxylase Tpa1-like proline 4-hydroxylase
MLKQFTQWLESTTPTPTTTDDDDQPRSSKAERQQHLIGWRHFILGRMSIEWGHIINRHLDEASITNTNAEKWGADLLRIHWKQVLKYGDADVKTFTAPTQRKSKYTQKIGY